MAFTYTEQTRQEILPISNRQQDHEVDLIGADDNQSGQSHNMYSMANNGGEPLDRTLAGLGQASFPLIAPNAM